MKRRKTRIVVVNLVLVALIVILFFLIRGKSKNEEVCYNETSINEVGGSAVTINNQKGTVHTDATPIYVALKKVIEQGNSEIKNLSQNLYLISNKDYKNFMNSRITYELPSGKKYVLAKKAFTSWLVQSEDGNYVKDEEVWNQNIENFVTNELTELTNNVGEAKEFKPTGLDYTVVVEGGDYGYQLDVETEIQKLKEELEAQEIITREPCYKKTEVSTENYGLGNSYVEIDLTRQKVWVYVDGNLQIETDCVTGCINKGYETPTGIFTLTYKQKDRVLRGAKLANDKYEYESHVDYWMPFNGGIGLHDATWRSTFGGNIYVSNGSHGCINLPLEKARQLYEIINDEMPIIVYKS